MVSSRAQSKKANICFLQDDSDHQSTDPGAIIGSNDDLLTLILIRLPAASILRFKSVSKHWLWLLSDRHFTQRYDKLLKSPGLFAHNNYVPLDVVENPNPNTNTPPFRSLDCYFDSPGVKILHSCNGLLLCCTDQGPKDVRNYYVFNPTTKQLELIPPLPKRIKYVCHMALAFHPTHCLHYKLVCVCRTARLFQIQIYSSNTRKWKISIKNFSASEQVFRYGWGVYWNGAVHWVSIYFKLDVEQLQTLPLPEGMMLSEMVTQYFGESRGHLHLIAYNSCQEDSLHLNVYEMLSDHSGWFVKYLLQLDQLVVAFPEMISPYFSYYFLVLDVVRSEEDEGNTFVVLKTRKNFITYNVRDKSFKQISSSPEYLRQCPEDFHRYTEILSSF